MGIFIYLCVLDGGSAVVECFLGEGRGGFGVQSCPLTIILACLESTIIVLVM